MTDNNRPQGLGKADQALSGGGGRGRWPIMQLKPADRARFHFLTTGGDPHFDLAQFHEFGEWGQPNRRTIVCVKSLTLGEESCTFCEEGHQDTSNQFAAWVHCHFILHNFDNPDQEAASWSTVKVRVGKDAQGQDVIRNMFKEDLDKPQIIWMKAGREKKWMSQFTSRWTAYSSLLKHQYELLRTGEALDTEYWLSEVKEETTPKKLLEAVSELPSIATVFRDGLRFAGSTATAAPAAAGMGQDRLEQSALPTVEDIEQLNPEEVPELL